MNRDGQLHQLLSLEYANQCVKLIALAHLDGLPMTARYVEEAIFRKGGEVIMANQTTETRGRVQVNLVGLEKGDYPRPAEHTLPGLRSQFHFGQIIAACYELNLEPENVLSSAGSDVSKSPALLPGTIIWFQRVAGGCLPWQPGQFLPITTEGNWCLRRRGTPA